MIALGPRRGIVSFTSGSPTPVTGMAAWWNAYTGVTKNGSDLVSAVADQSGNARHLGIPVGGYGNPLWQANQFNSRPAILFRNDLAPNFNYLQATFALNQPCTIYLLTKIVTRGALDYLFDGVAGTARLGTLGPANSLRVDAGAFLDNATGTDGQLQIHTIVLNGVSSSYQINNLTAAAGDAGANNPGGITINIDRTLAAFVANQNWLEMLVYTGAHNAGQTAQNKAYLAYIGGLTI